MRIWIIHQHAIPPTVTGPTRHYDLAKELIDRGHEVTIFASNFCHNRFEIITDSYKKTGQVDEINGVPFVWIQSPKYFGNSIARLWNMAMFAFNVLQLDYSNLAPPDVIIGSSPSPFAAYAAKKLADRFKARFIYEIRDLWPETLINLGHFKKTHPFVLLLAHLEKYLLKNAKAVITALPGVANYLEQRKLPGRNLLWLPNFINVDKIVVNPIIAANHRLKILYAGSFNVANDVKTLLESAKILEQQQWSDRISIQLMGEGPQKASLQKWVHENNLSMIEFLEPVTKQRIFDVLQTADIFVGLVKDSPLYQWGTSLNKITDYMACARPIIFALNSPFDPVSEAQAGITIPPENPEQLAFAMIKLANQSLVERNQLGQNARNYVQAHYNLRPLVDKLESHLSSL